MKFGWNWCKVKLYMWRKDWADKIWNGMNIYCFWLLAGIHVPLCMIASPQDTLRTYLITTLCHLVRTVSQSILHSPDRGGTGYVIYEASCQELFRMSTWRQQSLTHQKILLRAELHRGPPTTHSGKSPNPNQSDHLSQECKSWPQWHRIRKNLEAIFPRGFCY